MTFDPNASPINALPRMVILLVVAMLGTEVVFWLAASGLAGGVTDEGAGLRGQALRDYAFFPAVAEAMWQRQEFPLEHVMRFITYPFFHLSFMQALFPVVFTLALGKMVGEVFGGLTIVAVFLGSAALAALVFTVLVSGNIPLVGGMPPAYGLIGSYTYILWVGYGAAGANQYRAFQLIGFLLAIQLIFGVLFGANPDWVAEVAGFVAGFAITVIARPGGVATLLARMRGR